MLSWAHLVYLVAGSGLMIGAIRLRTAYNNELDTLRKTHVERRIPEILSESGERPKIAWLMSFPNSGTSFTISMVRQLCHLSTATNYGSEFRKNGESVPVHFDSSLDTPRPPFWHDPDGRYDFERPDDLVLTKTHCGGYRHHSSREELLNQQTFLEHCLSGWGVVKGKAHRQGDYRQYSVDLVQKAVHLIRNPFDNIVARFHLELENLAKDNNTGGVTTAYAKSKEGFRKFCRDVNLKNEDKGALLMDPNTWSLMRDVPCHDDFFRFLKWHNMAFVTTQNLGLPTMVVNYESYETKYNETATEILEFLQYERKGNLLEFVTGKKYMDYFTMEERENVKHAMKKLALPATWEHISHYFD